MASALVVIGVSAWYPHKYNISIPTFHHSLFGDRARTSLPNVLQTNVKQRYVKQRFTSILRKVHLHLAKAKFFQWSLLLLNVNIKFDSLWTYLERCPLRLIYTDESERKSEIFAFAFVLI